MTSTTTTTMATTMTGMETICLLTLPELTRGVVVKRPSKDIKSPYVADVMLHAGNKDKKEGEGEGKGEKEDTQQTILAHTASLGCCGLCEKDCSVWMMSTPSSKSKCQYRVMLSSFEEKGHTITVGINPKTAEDIVFQALKMNCVNGLKAKTIAKEKTILNSRFDFVGKDENDDYYVLEVKNVPLADYVDIEAKERKKMNFDAREWDDKIAYFPDGYRKKKDATVSERAVKHITELMEIKKQSPSVRTILLFVVQREDVRSFQPSRLDKIYLEAVRLAYENGVEIKTLQVVWRENMCMFMRNDLPIHLYDN